MFVDGEWVDARSGETFETVDPFTGRAWATLPRAAQADVDAAVGAARRAFDDGPWRRAPGKERARLLRRLAELVDQHAQEIATIEVTDNGKLLREMEQQLRGLPDYFHYWAGAADKIHGETLPGPTPDWLVYTVREPVGVVAAITPWNSPVLLMTWKLAPALAAGCTVVVKPAEQAPASTLEFARLVEEAGFPPGVFNVVTGFGPDAGAPLAAHPGRGQGRVHGLDRHGHGSDAGRRGAPRARDAGAGRQVAQRGVRRRRPRGGRQRRRGRHLRRLGADLHGRLAPARARVGPRRAARAGGGSRGGGAARRPAARRDRDGAAGVRGPSRQRAAADRRRRGGGRAAGHRRPAARRRRSCATASSSSRPSSPTCATTCRSRARRSSGPSSR